MKNAASTILQIRGLTKRYGDNLVLDDVALDLRHGEVLALCGPSGCGKTTLIRIVCGLIGFDAGELRIANHVISASSPYPSQLFGKIGVIFQEHNLFPHMTALENVTLALREYLSFSTAEARERGLHELARMGVEDLAGRYPAKLSGGEKQRVAIARALATDPLLLLLDEPTANLDPDRVDEVCDRILELTEQGMTMLLVTHNTAFARQAARSFALVREGKCRTSTDAALLDDLRGARTGAWRS